MTSTIFSTLSGTLVAKHETTGLLCSVDGLIKNRQKGGENINRPFVWTKGYNGRRGYLSVQFKGKCYFVHRLIAECFLPNPFNYKTIDHINRNKKDNRLCNLRWADNKIQQDNTSLVINRDKRITVRNCDNPLEYNRQKHKFMLSIITPEGKRTTTKILSDENFKLLKTLSTKERYYKYKELYNE